MTSITSITTISGSAGGVTGEADVTLRVKGSAATVEEVRSHVERACGVSLKSRDEVERDLERLIDGNSLRAVLDALAGIAHAKAAHVQENWQDSALALRWTRAGKAIERAVLHADQNEV